ncbi:MAG: hypothetical protein LRZ92_01050, partial [Methanosarcinaceae archaeon]|nr:hypothetical protein [Methanosarcinaceae archaeon]
GVLLLTESKITEHIIRNISTSIYDLQNKLDINEATIVKRYFSEISELKGREEYCVSLFIQNEWALSRCGVKISNFSNTFIYHTCIKYYNHLRYKF